MAALEGAGWRVERATRPPPLPDGIRQRHPELPPLALEFFSEIHACVRSDEACWLLAAADYAGPVAEEAFRWDELERIFTEDPTGGELAAKVRAYWDRYLPILLRVDGDYEFLAIGTDAGSDDFGKVVHGFAIEFDESSVIAESYADFLAQFADIARRQPTAAEARENDLAYLVHSEIREEEGGGSGGGLMAKLRDWLGGGRS